MKRRIFLIVMAAVTFQFSACEEVDNVLKETGLTNEEVIQGLKSALTVGTDTSVTTLSTLDGYYGDAFVKILLPSEAQVILANISKIPAGDLLLENAIRAINRSAEDAAVEAKPILVNAIKNITIADGFSILNGTNDAATTYLKTNTNNDLFAAFRPKISVSLNKKLIGNVSAESAYSSLINTYNTASLNGLLFPEVKTNSLAEHTTQKALDGLFFKVSEEEAKIRTDVRHRVNDILKKVFGEQ